VLPYRYTENKFGYFWTGAVGKTVYKQKLQISQLLFIVFFIIFVTMVPG